MKAFLSKAFKLLKELSLGGSYVSPTNAVRPPRWKGSTGWAKPNYPTPPPPPPKQKLFCECMMWCNDGRMSALTSHHYNCPRFNDSLIDAWVVSLDGSSYTTNIEPNPNDLIEGEEVKKIQIHEEVYEKLPEFKGF